MTTVKNKVREVLSFTNQEIISYRLRFSKLIMAFEGIPWGDAQRKAEELISLGEANLYLDNVRSAVNNQQTVSETVKQVKPVLNPIGSDSEENEELKVVKPIPKPEKQDIFRDNFFYLENLLSGLDFEEPNSKFYGIASKIASPDYTVEIDLKTDNGFYLILTCYDKDVKKENERYRLKIFADNNSKTVHPISFSDAKGVKVVYLDEDITGFVSETERTAQNVFLNQLFERLMLKGYSFAASENPIVKQEAQQQIKRARTLMQELDARQKEQREKEREAIREKEEADNKREEEDNALMYQDLKDAADRENALIRLQENINEAIPNFLPGEVELTGMHKILGFTLADIIYINQNRHGFLAIAEIEAIADDLDEFSRVLADKVQRIGMRITKNGKILIQGGSIKGDAA